ncbi:MAG TPA: FtsX-like permease family protein [Opitutaceae bacterium]|nr:FtsX-like permease family protein [Opitutaceae bacterium]
MNFILKMAWRDSRSSRRRLALFSLSIVLGIAALVSIGSFGDNLKAAIDVQAKTLLGADIVVTTREALTPEGQAYIESLGGERASEINLTTMLAVPKAGGAARLIQARAIDGPFPFYGDFVTEPASALAAYRAGEGVILEESLMLQFDIVPGDEVKIGRSTFRVLGALKKMAGESPVLGLLAPRVLLAGDALEGTGLIQPGNISRFRTYFRFAPGTDVEAMRKPIQEALSENRVGIDTVEERKRELGRTMDNINSFLRLVGFVALLLGAVGVGSAMHVYVNDKLATVAVLRCLGARVRTAFAIYLVQGFGLGAMGAILGGALGVAVQRLLPMIAGGMLPFEVEFGISWPAVLRGTGAGFAVGILFALLPLLRVRRVSPLRAVRANFEEPGRRRRDPLTIVVTLLIAAGVVAMALAQSTRWQIGLGFAGGIIVVFLLLAGIARTLSWAVRRWFPTRMPYVWRQGLANLHRPNNRTGMLMLSLGMGTFLMVTLFLVRGTVLSQWSSADRDGRPNLVLFDIQDDQHEGVTAVLAEAGAPAMQQAPIVTMRIAELKGRPIEEILRDKESRSPSWTLRREYRSTFRSEISNTEEVIAGEWVASVPEGTEIVPVSVEQDIARDLGLALGDEFVFNVQGVPVKCRVASLRRVDWRRMQPNFFVVFPAGVLEEAPKFHIMAARTADARMSAEVQRRVVQNFPNVSAIDLTVVVETIDNIVGKASYVVNFMALFTVATGIIVLAGAILTGRFQRIRENVLLRTLGASRRQVLRIMLVEYAVLGALGGLAGGVLAIGANIALAAFVFETGAVNPGIVPAVAVVVVAAVTLTTGLLSNRGVLDHPPLQVLRQET